MTNLPQIALVGNPNAGKTTVFNGLTGAQRRVGNWSGVTVECQVGQLTLGDQTISVVDLPGVYDLGGDDSEETIDQRVATDYLANEAVDVVVNVVDGSQLERHLYLTALLLAQRRPLVVVVNLLDVAERRGISLDLEALERCLGCPVVGVVATQPKDIARLKKTLLEVVQSPRIPAMPPTVSTESEEAAASDYYEWTESVMAQVIQKTETQRITGTERIDRWVLNRALGLPIFLGVMYLLFFFSINLGGAFQDLFDVGGDALLVQGVAHILQSWHCPDWLVAMLSQGAGKGVATVLTFIPVIGAMFFGLALLEDSGYMARAVFVIDRLMRAVGLPGQSFVPMIIGFGCNVPAVMSARTLPSPRDRVLTILMAPFMSCGARLTVFALFATAFFPQSEENVVFSLYLIGIALAVLTGVALRKTLVPGPRSALVMELPPYRKPRLVNVWRYTWARLQGFLRRAGKVIVPLCMLIGALQTVQMNGGKISSPSMKVSESNSLLAYIGRSVTPVFSPMGIQQDNWPATVGLLGGVLAKEVVVGTLNTLYSGMAHPTSMPGKPLSVRAQLKAAWQTIPDNLAHLVEAGRHPFSGVRKPSSVNHVVFGEMYKRFDGKRGAFAYLLFVLLYLPCVSTLAVTGRELNQRWALFSLAWSTGLAYGVSVIFYQLATFYLHPQSSLCWVLGFIVAWFLLLRGLQFSSKRWPQDWASLSVGSSRDCGLQCNQCDGSITAKP